jgi:hypothetical protein
MKKQLLSAIITGCALFTCQIMFGQALASVHNRGCASMEYKDAQEQNDPALKATRDQIEKESLAYIQEQMLKKTPDANTVYTIPIVFHIVYNTAAQNVSDACIAATVASFNKDFRKLNADFATKCPSVFQGVAADFEIQFCLASKDPTGAATNGITRTSTTQTSFTTDDKVKYTAQGGHDAWDHTKYVNMWICNLGGGLLGYGTFPGQPAATDGVVCHVSYLVASGGCGLQPYELGRTTVHELGHFFGLRHIWGDANCGNDNVADTPTQQTSNFGKPTFPHVTCSNGPNGDMFMNYMDYVDDAAMVMFTAGQKTVIVSTLNGTRSGLKTSSATLCSAGTGVNELSLNNHVYIYPNPSTGDIFLNMSDAGISKADVFVYNAIGEAVLEKKIVVPSSNEVKLDMNSIPNGIYLIKMKSAEGVVTKKIIINR